MCPTLLSDPLTLLATITMTSESSLGGRIRLARIRAGLSQQELADRAGLSKNWVGQLERGIATNPGIEVLHRLEAALHIPLTGGSDKPLTRSDTVIPLSEHLLKEGLRRPVYRWGSTGDPRQSDTSPYPDREEYPPVGRESLVGPNGFGVIMRGESMSRRGIHDEDIVWCNPDRPYQPGRVVLARAWDVGEYEIGMLVKVLRTDDSLWGDGEGEEGNNPVLCSRFEVIGPIVWVQPVGSPPR